MTVQKITTEGTATMIENEHAEDVPVMAAHTLHGSWPVPLDDDEAFGVSALAATMLGPDGAETSAVVALTVSPEMVDSDGAVRMLATTATDLAAVLDHAAGIARRAVLS